jgi:phosphoribosylglycinamide formyltransferase 1
MMRIGVLASGGGTNLQALLEYLDALGRSAPARVVLVASDRRSAGAMGHATARGIAAVHMPAEMVSDGAQVEEMLSRHAVDLIVLAGYLRLVPASVVSGFRGKMVNIHPALLPAFGGAGMYGSRIHEAVLASGARLTGATVHFVDEVYDRGPIIAQWPVPVLEGDDAASLAARVLRVEHQLYPRAIHAVAAGLVSMSDDGTILREHQRHPTEAIAFTYTFDFDSVGRELDRQLKLNATRTSLGI